MSKQLDFSITQEVLRAYGDVVKEAMKQVLQAVAAAWQDGVAIDISGMDEFDTVDFGTDLDDAKKLLDLGIASETLKTQIHKRLAFKYLCDARQEINSAGCSGGISRRRRECRSTIATRNRISGRAWETDGGDPERTCRSGDVS